MMKNRFNFSDQNVCVTLNDSNMAEIQVNGKRLTTTYDDSIGYIDLSKKLTKLVEKENKKTSNPLQALFAFGESFCMELAGVLKGRI